VSEISFRTNPGIEFFLAYSFPCPFFTENIFPEHKINEPVFRSVDGLKHRGKPAAEVFAIWQPLRHISSLYAAACPLIFSHAPGPLARISVFDWENGIERSGLGWGGVWERKGRRLPSLAQ